MLNLNYIKEQGIENYIDAQKRRIRLLVKLLQDFDDGRSKSFFCKAVALLDIKSIEDSLNKTFQKIKPDKIMSTDIKIRAKILKNILNENALRNGILLTKK